MLHVAALYPQVREIVMSAAIAYWPVTYVQIAASPLIMHAVSIPLLFLCKLDSAFDPIAYKMSGMLVT